MKKTKKIYFDNIHNTKIKEDSLDYVSARLNLKKTLGVGGNTLFSKGLISNTFFTEDSKLYITPREQARMNDGRQLDREVKKWDALSNRIVQEYIAVSPSQSAGLHISLRERVTSLEQDIADASRSFTEQFTLVRMWNMSIVGAILFGMVSMTFIYRFLGQGAAAGIAADTINRPAIERQLEVNEVPMVLGQEIEKDEEVENLGDDPDEQFQREVKEMVKGYPIEEMLPYILEKDKKVASFLVSIAKKESSWGQRVPVLNGQDCYNYWGYRGQRKLMGTGGHTCFNSRKDAVDTVAKRISTLVNEKGKNTPEKMVLWKCGDKCSSDGGAKKWVSDVNIYFKKLND